MPRKLLPPETRTTVSLSDRTEIEPKSDREEGSLYSSVLIYSSLPAESNQFKHKLFFITSYQLQSTNRKFKCPCVTKSSAHIISVEVNLAHTMTGTLKAKSVEKLKIADFSICFCWKDCSVGDYTNSKMQKGFCFFNEELSPPSICRQTQLMHLILCTSL